MELDSPGARLRKAREDAGYADAAAFAKVLKMKEVTYRAYENDQNGFAKHAPEFAKKLGVTTDWLLRGDPQPEAVEPPADATHGDFSERIPSEEQLKVVIAKLGRDLFDLRSLDEGSLEECATAWRVFLLNYAMNPKRLADRENLELAVDFLIGRSVDPHRRAQRQ